MKITKNLFAALMLGVFAFACSNNTAENKGPSTMPTPKVAGPPVYDDEVAVFETDYGSFKIALYTDVAPLHVENFKKLIREKFYDGVPFHRVIAGFMAQTGDGQNFNGTGGSKYPNLPAEFSNVPFKRGIVGMARKGGDNNSANSQFFIMFGDGDFLNGKYTVVGEVLSGMEVVDKLKKGSQANNGTVSDPDRMVTVRVAADVK